jgi:hypothetical protein
MAAAGGHHDPPGGPDAGAGVNEPAAIRPIDVDGGDAELGVQSVDPGVVVQVADQVVASHPAAITARNRQPRGDGPGRIGARNPAILK